MVDAEANPRRLPIKLELKFDFKEHALNKNIIRRLIQVLLTLLIQGLILFGAAGTLYWTWAWIFLLVGVAILAINLCLMPKELIEERGRLKKDAKTWDKVLNGINVIPTILLYLCSGLDYRFDWTWRQ